MEKLRELFNLSFHKYEQILFKELKMQFCEAFRSLLEWLDEQVFSLRDKQRYKVVEKVSREVETLVGPVRFRRRCYLDRETGERVYLLDELCELPQRSRIAPGLESAVALLGTTCPSYRSAEENLKNLFGDRVLSHESIRQVIQLVGEKLNLKEAKQREVPAGKRKVPVLFLEVDGLWASLQREKVSSKEIRILVSHEGWERRHPGSKEHNLIHKIHFTWNGKTEDFWEEASRFLAAHYDLENTVVVINGDRAPWIRKGVEWFPRAIYQADRFHVQRDLRSLLKGQPEKLKTAMDAFEANDEGLLLATLAESVAVEIDPNRRRQLKALLNDLAKIPEALRDYRVRLLDYNVDTSGYRGLGAAESQMDRYSNRLKKRGQSWGIAGLRNMLAALNARFEGRLIETTEGLRQCEELLPQLRQRFGVGRITQALNSATIEPRSGGLPAKAQGLHASGGLARLMRHLSHPSFSAT